MAENDRTTQASVQTETPSPVQTTVAPTNVADTVPPPNNLSVLTSDNSGRTDTREDPAKMVESGIEQPQAGEKVATPKASSLSLEELQEKQRMGLLTLDEQKALEEKQNQPNDGSLRKLPDKDISAEDPKKKEFKEEDVIAYMYKEWLIEGALWCSRKAEKYFNYGCHKLREALREGNEAKKEEIKKIRSGKTYKNAEKIEGLWEKKHEEILAKTQKTEKDINDIGAAINDGTLFDDNNKELLKKYEKMIGADTEEGKKKLEATRSACETRKANPEDTNAALGTKKIAAEFARDAKVNLAFDNEIEVAALNLTAANMLTNISYQPDKYKDIGKSFDMAFDANVATLSGISQKDREHALATVADKDRIQAAAQYAGVYGADIVAHTQRQWDNNFETLRKVKEDSFNGMQHALKDIGNGQTAEFGKEPNKNAKLESAIKRVSAKQEVVNPAQHAPTQPAPARVEPETSPMEPKTLEEEAIVQAQADEELAKKQQQVSTNPRAADVARREQDHKDKGQKINPRIEEIKARAMASRQAKQSGAEFMVDSMLANGNLTSEQQEALLNAGIAAEKSGKDGSTDQILNNMRESGQFSQDQIKTAREINYAYGLAQKTGRE